MKMKVKLFILVLFIGFVSCDRTPTPIGKVDNYNVIMIGDCEYLNYGGIYSSNSVLTHKGDCSNPIHKCPCK